MKAKLLQSIALASVTALCVTACDVYVRSPEAQVAVPGPVVGAEVDVTGPPPPPPVDVDIGVAPGPDFVVVPGAYAWVGGRWEWQRAHWDRPPHAGAHWVANHYEYRNGRHVFVRGGWK